MIFGVSQSISKVMFFVEEQKVFVDLVCSDIHSYMQLILKPAEMLKTRVRKMSDKENFQVKMTSEARTEIVSSALARTPAADVDSLQSIMGRSFDHPDLKINPNDQPLNFCERRS